ncbi:uncharacterized protein LOC142342120 [Convolutriloba macropyga]|uniref:uncharacterized protein LOC142342120 n=1 Tax=Convolutriloba macropyga TaxID=536237 RepID=UPI003F51B9E4
MSSRKVYIEGLQSASQRSGWQVRMSSESERQMLNNSPPSIQHVQEEDNQGSIQPNVARQNTAEISKLGVFLPTAKRFTEGDAPTLPIPKGPNHGYDLALVDGGTAQVLGRRASKKLWTHDELKNHMLSPKEKSELFRLKYESNWVHMYELAKISVNNRGNELKSNERRSNESGDVLESDLKISNQENVQ